MNLLRMEFLKYASRLEMQEENLGELPDYEYPTLFADIKIISIRTLYSCSYI